MLILCARLVLCFGCSQDKAWRGRGREELSWHARVEGETRSPTRRCFGRRQVYLNAARLLSNLIVLTTFRAAYRVVSLAYMQPQRFGQVCRSQSQLPDFACFCCCCRRCSRRRTGGSCHHHAPSQLRCPHTRDVYLYRAISFVRKGRTR